MNDVADFESVEEEGEDLEDEGFLKGADAAKKALRGAGEQDSDLLGEDFSTHVASRTRSAKATEEAQEIKEAGKDAQKEAGKEPYKIVPLKGQNSPPQQTKVAKEAKGSAKRAGGGTPVLRPAPTLRK